MPRPLDHTAPAAPSPCGPPRLQTLAALSLPTAVTTTCSPPAQLAAALLEVDVTERAKLAPHHLAQLLIMQPHHLRDTLCRASAAWARRPVPPLGIGDRLAEEAHRTGKPGREMAARREPVTVSLLSLASLRSALAAPPSRTPAVALLRARLARRIATRIAYLAHPALSLPAPGLAPVMLSPTPTASHATRAERRYNLLLLGNASFARHEALQAADYGLRKLEQALRRAGVEEPAARGALAACRARCAAAAADAQTTTLRLRAAERAWQPACAPT